MNIRNFSKFVALAALCLFIGQTAANAASLTLTNVEVYATPDDGSYTGTRTVTPAGEVISETWTPSTLDTAAAAIKVDVSGVGKINFHVNGGPINSGGLGNKNASVDVGSYWRTKKKKYPRWHESGGETIGVQTDSITHPCLPTYAAIRGSLYYYSAYNWSANGSATPVYIEWYPSVGGSIGWPPSGSLSVAGNWTHRTGTASPESGSGSWSASITDTASSAPPPSQNVLCSGCNASYDSTNTTEEALHRVRTCTNQLNRWPYGYYSCGMTYRNCDGYPFCYSTVLESIMHSDGG